MGDKFGLLLSFLPGLVIGLTVHEASHAYASLLLGDDLAKSRGRLTLNPLKHLSLLGTLALFVIGFGWARPVPVNPYNYKNPKRDYLLSSLAGPASNVIICLICAVIIRFFGMIEEEKTPSLIAMMFIGTYFINAILAVINLLPIPPLDGSKIWPCIIPGMKIEMPVKFAISSNIILIILIFSGAIDPVLGAVMEFLRKLLFLGV